MYAFVMRVASWHVGQLALSFAFAAVNVSAAVQCSTGTSKRWYLAGGRLSTRLLLIIIIETTVQIAILYLTFDDGENVWHRGRNTALALCGLISLVHGAPLPVRRAPPPPYIVADVPYHTRIPLSFGAKRYDLLCLTNH